MSIRQGKNLPISRFRGLVMDLLSFCQKVPGATVERPMNLAALIAARQACSPKPSWCAIFLKAMSIVAERRSELRRSYMPFPWPHLYEHPVSVGNFTIERQHEGEDLVFFVQVRSPDKRSLAELDRIIRTCKDEPVETLKFFKRASRLSKVPWPFRRISMWVALNVFGKLRCHNFGTFTITSVAAEGAGIVVLTPLLTSTLHYGLFDERGDVNMRITFDHRVTDGAVVARSLVDLEEILLGEILQELQPLRVFKAA